MDEPLPGYRDNAIAALRDSHLKALEEIAKEKVVYFSGVDEEFVIVKRKLATINEMIKTIKYFTSGDPNYVGPGALLKAVLRRKEMLMEKESSLCGRQNQIKRIAERIEDIVMGFGFEHQTITPPDEYSLDYIIYIREREGHVDVLSDRDLQTKSMGMRLYSIPECEFEGLCRRLSVGLTYDKASKRSLGWMLAGFTAGAYVPCGVFTLVQYLYPEFIDTPTKGLIAAGSSLVFFIGSVLYGFTRYKNNNQLIAKGSKALLHPSIQKQFHPQYRVPEEPGAALQSTAEAELEAEFEDYVIMNAALISSDNTNL